MTANRLQLDQFFPYRLSMTSNLVSGVIASAYETEFGLRIPEWRLMTVLAEQPGASQQALGQRTRMDKVTVSRAAATLVERGLVTSARSGADGRLRRLELSAAGEALYARVAPKALELERRLLADFSAADLERFDALLRHLETRAEHLRLNAPPPGDGTV